VPGLRGRSDTREPSREPVIGRYRDQPPPSPPQATCQRDPPGRRGRAARSMGTAIGWSAGVSLGVGTTGMCGDPGLAVQNDGSQRPSRPPLIEASLPHLALHGDTRATDTGCVCTRADMCVSEGGPLGPRWGVGGGAVRILQALCSSCFGSSPFKRSPLEEKRALEDHIDCLA